MSIRAIAAVLMLPLYVHPSIGHASSDEERLLATLRQRLPKTEFSAVNRTDIPELFEVWMGSNVAYLCGRNPRYFLLGRLFDTETLKDLTAAKLAKTQATSEAAAVDLRALPIADAIKTVRGNGERKLVVFSDPACPYCKRLEREVAKLADVTLYTFLLPFQGEELPNAIWCAPDRQAAWSRYMGSGDTAGLALGARCASPLARNSALAQRLDIAGTPALLFMDGSRISGVADAAEIEARLTKAARQPASVAAGKSKEQM